MNLYENVVNAMIDGREQELYEVLKEELKEEVKAAAIDYRKVIEISEVMEKLEVFI